MFYLIIRVGRKVGNRKMREKYRLEEHGERTIECGEREKSACRKRHSKSEENEIKVRGK